MSVTLTRGTDTDFRIPWVDVPENLESVTAEVKLYATTDTAAEPSFVFGDDRITLDAAGATVDVQPADYATLTAAAYLLELTLDYGSFTTRPLPPTMLYISRHGSPSPVSRLGIAGGQIPGPPGPPGEDGAPGEPGEDGTDAFAPTTINAQTGTTYTLAAGDAVQNGTALVALANGGPITLTVPSGTFSAGQRVDIAQRGAGAVTVVGDGVTVNAPPGGSLVTEGQYAYASVFFISSTVADVVGLMAAP